MEWNGGGVEVRERERESNDFMEWNGELLVINSNMSEEKRVVIMKREWGSERQEIYSDFQLFSQHSESWW